MKARASKKVLEGLKLKLTFEKEHTGTVVEVQHIRVKRVKYVSHCSSSRTGIYPQFSI